MVPQPNTLEQETVHSLLADRVREYLLRYLSVVNRATISDAAERITEWVREMTPTLETQREAVTVQLVHNHLPRLAHHDVVEYDQSTAEITPGSNFADLEPYVADLELPADPQQAE